MILWIFFIFPRHDWIAAYWLVGMSLFSYLAVNPPTAAPSSVKKDPSGAQTRASPQLPLAWLFSSDLSSSTELLSPSSSARQKSVRPGHQIYMHSIMFLQLFYLSLYTSTPRLGTLVLTVDAVLFSCRIWWLCRMYSWKKIDVDCLRDSSWQSKAW